MPRIEGQYSMRLKSIGNDDHAEIGQSGIQGLILLFKIDNYGVIFDIEAGDRKPPGGDIPQECSASNGTQPTPEQIVDLCGDRSSDDEFSVFVA